MQLIFATNNAHKIEELQAAIGHQLEIITLHRAGIHADIPEPHDTLEANASEKSKAIYTLTGKNTFSEDTGLEVTALNGEPGVKSARYAGAHKDFGANIRKLLKNLDGKLNRKARFRTVISLIWNSQEYLFEGVCEGQIVETPRGSGGFGYDPVFMPDGGSGKTFAEMNMAEKNLYSHRRKAADKLVTFLHQHINIQSQTQTNR
jgi:XTP/dITP diphosphohydrolase